MTRFHSPIRLLMQAALWGAALFSTKLGTAAEPEPLAGTKPLTLAEPLDVAMVAGIDRFALKELAASAERREVLWKRDYSNPEAYAKSIAANRERFRTILGAVDPRVKGLGIEFILSTDYPHHEIAHAPNYRVSRVRWQVLDGVTAEGLWLTPTDSPIGFVIALPDADWTPEMFCGVEPGVPVQAQLPRRLAENGFSVLVPTLISRDDTHSGNPAVRFTNQPHREYIYRQAFELGRHIIGYEVQKVLAAVDQFEEFRKRKDTPLPLGVCGVGEGALLALHSAALDPRIDAAMVCGYFQRRDGVWEEPIYRNLWSQLTEFGDAEIASLIAPRTLVIEACGVSEVAGPPAVKPGRSGGAAPGKIENCTLGYVRTEFDKAKTHYTKLKSEGAITLVSSGEGDAPAGSESAIAAFAKGLRLEKLKPSEAAANRTGQPDGTPPYDIVARQKRQVEELSRFTQALLGKCASVRDVLWSKVDRSSPEKCAESLKPYRDMVYNELIGRLPDPTMPLNPRTRKLADLETPEYTAYEVVLDVYPDVIAGGILLLPKGMKEGEKRPVVVCQHGLEGVPRDTIQKDLDGFKYYSAFTSELAKRGFITYAPQNPYRGKDLFRTLQRKSNPMKRSLYSYIIPQHARTLDFLASLPNVDPERMGFYGLSYGGKTAVRVPPILTRYACSICSADYDEWVLKISTDQARYSYVFTGEYEISEWNMGHLANYAELSYLMTPRPFMVERGHDDGVAPDEWVAWEFAKVRRHYNKLKLGDKAEIEYFDGPHMIHGVGTYDFLHRHLKWPKPATATAGK